MSEARSKPYCLRCYNSLPDTGSTCGRCGYSNPLALRRKYWTREPAVVRIETWIKALIVFLTATTCVAILLFASIWLGSMRVWCVVIIGIIGIAFWQTASRLTARGGYFHATGFWLSVFLLLAGVLTFHDPVLVPIPLALAGLVWLFSRMFSRWKRGKIDRGPIPHSHARIIS